MKRHLTQAECDVAAQALATYAVRTWAHDYPVLYGVPRGGVPVSYLVRDHMTGIHPESATITEVPANATLIVDDIIDSGRTKDRYNKEHRTIPFLALTDFLKEKRRKGEWIVFPWESRGDEIEDESATDIVVRLLQFTGEDPDREGLKETPKRFLSAWKEWMAGYEGDPKTVLKCFTDGAANYDEMVVQRNIPFYSHCEHHLAPFFGTITIGYIPKKRVVGLSKLSRLADIFARRLQVQERMTTQIAQALMEALEPLGVAVFVRARHLCMESRGIAKQGHVAETCALRGVFITKPEARAEFLSLARV